MENKKTKPLCNRTGLFEIIFLNNSERNIYLSTPALKSDF